MGHAGRETADGGQLVRLRELPLRVGEPRRHRVERSTELAELVSAVAGIVVVRSPAATRRVPSISASTGRLTSRELSSRGAETGDDDRADRRAPTIRLRLVAIWRSTSSRGTATSRTPSTVSSGAVGVAGGGRARGLVQDRAHDREHAMAGRRCEDARALVDRRLLERTVLGVAGDAALGLLVEAWFRSRSHPRRTTMLPELVEHAHALDLRLVADRLDLTAAGGRAGSRACTPRRSA